MLTRRSFLNRSAKGLAWMGLAGSTGRLDWLSRDARAESVAEGETVVRVALIQLFGLLMMKVLWEMGHPEEVVQEEMVHKSLLPHGNL